jgi:hypothetical protein
MRKIQAGVLQRRSVVGQGKSWVRHASITSVIGLDRSKLSPKALTALDKQPNLQHEMLLCLLASEVDTRHDPGMLSIQRMDNILGHMESFHPSLFAAMEKAKQENKDMDTAFCNWMSNRNTTKQRGVRQLSLTKFGSRLSASPGSTSGVAFETGVAKEVAQVLCLVDTATSFESMDHSVTHVTNSVLDLCLPGAEATKARAALVAVAVRQIRRKQLQECRFISTTADFATVSRRLLFVQTYHGIAMGWRSTIDIGLDVVEFDGTHYSVNIADVMKSRIDSHTNDSCLHVQSTSDSASDMRKAVFVLMGHISFFEADETTVTKVMSDLHGAHDGHACNTHLEHLGVVEVLGVGGNLGSAAAVSADLVLIHCFALHLKLHQDENKVFLHLQKENGVSNALGLVDIECVTCWNDRHRALERFLLLQQYVEQYYMANTCTFQINDHQVLPVDGLLDVFWQ